MFEIKQFTFDDPGIAITGTGSPWSTIVIMNSLMHQTKSVFPRFRDFEGSGPHFGIRLRPTPIIISLLYSILQFFLFQLRSEPGNAPRKSAISVHKGRSALPAVSPAAYSVQFFLHSGFRTGMGFDRVDYSSETIRRCCRKSPDLRIAHKKDTRAYYRYTTDRQIHN